MNKGDEVKIKQDLVECYSKRELIALHNSNNIKDKEHLLRAYNISESFLNDLIYGILHKMGARGFETPLNDKLYQWTHKVPLR